jgi:hypothetical protein
LFVDPVRGGDNNAGRRAEPFQTLARALDVAKSLASPEIYVGGGQLLTATYPVLEIHNLPNIALYGGYDPATWLRDPGQVSALWTDLSLAVVIASDGTTLDGFSIKAGNGRPGQTGPDGKPGARGEDGKKGADWANCPPDRLGGAGGAGAPGAGRGGTGGTGGAFGGFNGQVGETAGSTAGKAGVGGPTGILGEPGGYAADAITIFPGNAQGGNNLGTDGEDGQTNSLGGSGGGGGGGGGGGVFFVCGPGGGGGGGGGGPATSGKGGEGGGYSIGIYVQNGSATLTNNLIVTGVGGAGGNGGFGGLAGQGGLGGPGGSDGVNALARGGNGGDGTHGAAGGGGGGGPSVGIVQGLDATVTHSGNTFRIGPGGKGGEGGAQTGALHLFAEDGDAGLSAEFFAVTEEGTF